MNPRKLIILLLLPSMAALLPCNLNAQPAGSRKGHFELLREIDEAEGAVCLADFRRLWVPGDYSFHYTLKHYRSDGERIYLDGTLWGSRLPTGPVTLLQVGEVKDAHWYFLQNGFEPRIQRMEAAPASEFQDIEASQWRQSLEAGFSITAFDLLMPFIYWDEWEYEGVTKTRGRVAHIFLMKAPEAFQEGERPLAGVRVFLDEEFNAMLRAEYIDLEGEVVKTFRVLDLKKADDVWFLKTLDIRDHIRDEKTRLKITGVAFHQNFIDTPLHPGMPLEEIPQIDPQDYTLVN